jgi:2-polyprenyl-6-methoxyphenol hydroxylase-like FAD-dependent oxidoreductase
LAIQASSPAEEINEEKPFLATYQAMWVRFPTMSGLKPGDCNETHGPGAAIQLFAGEETTVIGIYARMDEPTRERQRFTQADEEAFVERWGHLPLSHGLTVRASYEARVGAGLVSLEEGVVDHWGWDRIVLAGDAAHKFTPSTAAGCNNGIVDVVVLANELHKIVQDAAGLAPSKEQIASAFKAYQDARYAAVVAGRNGASRATAAATWYNKSNRFVDRHIMGSAKFQKVLMHLGGSGIAKTPVLDFVEGEEHMNGKFPWVQQIRPVSLKAN